MLRTTFAASAAAAMATAWLAVAGGLPAQAATAHDAHLHAALYGSHAFDRARGTASFEAGDHGRELDVHVWHVARLAGSRLVVYVHGVRAGTMAVSGTGFAHLDRHGAPACRSGDRVRVRTRSGALVASGVFRRHHDG